MVLNFIHGLFGRCRLIRKKRGQIYFSGDTYFIDEVFVEVQGVLSLLGRETQVATLNGVVSHALGTLIFLPPCGDLTATVGTESASEINWR